MLHQVHGSHQLHLPQVEDARTERFHHGEQHFEQAYAYSRQHFELATSITNSAELKSLHETTVEIAPEHNEPTLSNAFRSAEETKVIGVDSNNPTKTVRIGT